MSQQGTAFQAAKSLVELNHLPASMNGDPILFAFSLTSIMCIACLGMCVAGWMIRDTFRDRFHVAPNTLLFNFRAMMGLAGLAAFSRAMPEVLYLQMFGDPEVPLQTQAAIMTAKRVADNVGLVLVLSWMIILSVIYPYIVLALKSGPANKVEVHFSTAWPRLLRPFGCVICIFLAAIFFTISKVYGFK